jgi:hypothetical protein
MHFHIALRSNITGSGSIRNLDAIIETYSLEHAEDMAQDIADVLNSPFNTMTVDTVYEVCHHE